MMTSQTFNISIFWLPFCISTDRFDKQMLQIRCANLIAFKYFCPLRVYIKWYSKPVKLTMLMNSTTISQRLPIRWVSTNSLNLFKYILNKIKITHSGPKKQIASNVGSAPKPKSGFDCHFKYTCIETDIQQHCRTKMPQDLSEGSYI